MKVSWTRKWNSASFSWLQTFTLIRCICKRCFTIKKGIYSFFRIYFYSHHSITKNTSTSGSEKRAHLFSSGWHWYPLYLALFGRRLQFAVYLYKKKILTKYTREKKNLIGIPKTFNFFFCWGIYWKIPWKKRKVYSLVRETFRISFVIFGVGWLLVPVALTITCTRFFLSFLTFFSHTHKLFLSRSSWKLLSAILWTY